MRRTRSTLLLLACALAVPAVLAAPPTSVSITSPSDGASIAVASPMPTIQITGAATPSGSGTIVSLNFLVNGVSIGTDTTSPYTVLWQPTSPGNYSLTAIATDSSSATGNTLQSGPITVTVSSVRLANIVAPANNAGIAQNSEIFLRSTATMSDGIVSQVEFLLTSVANGTVSLGAATGAPYNLATTLAVDPDTYTLVARVTGNVAGAPVTFDSAPITIIVATPIGNGPTVALTGPTGGDAIAAGSTVSVTATASDIDGFIPNTAPGGVTFYADGDPIGTDFTAPYSFNWSPTIPKVVSLRAQATDDRGNIRLSAPVNVTVTSTAPTVSITAPANNSTTSVGVPVFVTASATAPTGATVESVQFFENGVAIAPADTAPPYTVQWTPANIGTSIIHARVMDSSGNSVNSANINVNVGAASPTVTLNAPSTAVVNTVTTLTATANPGTNASITQVQFLLGPNVLGTDTTAPYSFEWTPTATGNATLSARVTDTNGATVTSPAVTVSVGTAPPSSGVTVALVPSTGALPAGSSRQVTATIPTTISPTRVDFYFNGQLFGSDTTSPYSIVFTAPAAPGVGLLVATAIGPGFEINSAPLSVTITNPVSSPPLAAIIAPSSGAFVAAGAATTIAGTATDPDGAITSVQVFVNGSSAGLPNNGLATLSGSNWSINWTPSTLGTASISAIATDNSGNAVAAPAVGVNVTDSSSPAVVLSLSPRTAGPGGVASTTLPSGAVRNVVADVTPSPGRATVRVEFFVDGTKVGEDTLAPYTFRFVAPELAPDELSRAFVFTARATDNAGAARDAQVPLLIVSPIGQPPVVSLLTPADGANVVPNSPVSLAATAVANGGSIASVQFYVNGSPAGINNGNAIPSAPYTTTFTPTAAGTYTIDAIATDDRGNTTISNSATITAAFATPTVVFTSPNPNAVARATPNVPLTLAATATVQAGAGASILLVEFLLDGVQIGADTTAPYTFSWIPTAADLGQHALTARVTDTHGQTSTSAPITLNVANVVGSPPTVSVSASPIPVGLGLQTASTVNFVANAVATGTGVTLRNVEIFLNDVSIGTAAREQATNLYRRAYDLNQYDFTAITPIINDNTGAVTYPVRLYAIARDSNNNQTVSPTVNLIINPATSSPPSVRLQALSPTNITAGTQFFMQPTIDDLDGVVTSIQLYANGSLVSTIANPQQGNPIQYNANNAGRFNLYAVATDDTGNTAVSSPSIVVNVTAVSAPTTAITRPSDNSTTTTVGAPVFLEGTAVNNATTQVPTLQFVATAQGGARQVITGQRVGTTTSYRAIWTPSNAETYMLTTQATVGTVQGTSSVSRRVVVSNLVGLAPTISLTRPQGTGTTSGVPTTATTASTASFVATANDPDGAVVGVEFFLNRNSIGEAIRDPQGNTWRITASFAGLQPGQNEVVALARDSSGNVVASPTNNINVTAASSVAPSITITPSTLNPAFNRQLQLRANARDTDGTVSNVQYFANGTSIATSTNAGTLFLTNWTPTASGTYFVWAVATDNTGITSVSPMVEVNVRRNNPVLEDAAFILQTYQDIGNTTNINPIVFDELDAQLGAGTLGRSDLVVSLAELPGFQAPVNLLAAYYVLMGRWPTPANYTTFLATARNSLANAVGSILNSNEYFARWGANPTVALLNNPASAIPADTFIVRLWQGAGLGTPSDLNNVQFRSNNVLTPTLGRGYGPAGLNAAVAEFITNTNSNNTALFNKARAAALFFQLARPPVTMTIEEITQRIDALLLLNGSKAIADAVLKDILYGYRYVTITKHPDSLMVAPRSGALFSVEANGAPPLEYRWLLNGAPIPGATNPLLSLTNVDATRIGTYTAVITSSAGIATSDAAVLTLSNTPTKLANISTRGTTTGAGANILIGGFVVTGNANQSRQMLIRVVGPRLGQAPFNISGFLADPRLEVYSSTNPNTPILTNDNWGTQTGGNTAVNQINQATNRAGAFTLQNNSADAVVLATLSPGLYTVQAKGPANNPNATGVVLIEAYDVTQGGPAAPKATNVSTRGVVGTGANIMIAGFVVNGQVSRRILIRGAGPTLQGFGLPANTLLADPQITLIEQSTGRTIKTNNDWATGDDAPVIAAAAQAAGAFPFANGSRDSAMIVMLPPGAYTVQLSGVNNGTGIGIVEVYDVDP